MESKETLEEVAEKYVDNFEYGIAHPRRVCKNAFIKGAKWQQERSYSEEEVKFIERLISFYWTEYNSEHPNNLKEFELSKNILEQFKKKRNKMKQTSIEWLYKNLLDNPLSNEDVIYNINVFEQAKEMHKQEIIECGNSCAIKQHLHNDRVNKMSMDEMLKFAEEETLTFGEQYYNETYNK